MAADESRVLVIYTGGTIGMLVGKSGYVPEPFFLTETLLSQTRFHDPMGDSLFSNSGSVQGFREWSSSGHSTPNLGPLLSQGQIQSTMLVRSCKPFPMPPAHLLKISSSSDKQTFFSRKISDNCYEMHLPSLVTPRSSSLGRSNKRIRYAVLEWSPLLDSSNMEIDDWVRIASEIEHNYENFDAFVVLSGTDTVCYTSSALSFLLEDLGKTVILTGAQIPLSQLRNDAVENLLGALSIAGQYIIPECSLFFNHTLYRGNRVSKKSSSDLNAFWSPNFPPLVKVGIDIVVNWDHVLRQTSLRRFKAHKRMYPHVATLRLFPGITASTVRAVTRPTQGLVLETFGAGNAPQRKDLINVFQEACDRGVVIVAISQCSKGSVSDAYETGRSLIDVGVVPGGDMTTECALAKLSYLLSKSDDLSVAEVRELIHTPLRGELTPPHPTITSLSPAEYSATSLGTISEILVHVSRISSTSTVRPRVRSLMHVHGEVTSPWKSTASETLSTESALLPFLIHLAAARDDVEGMMFCLSTSSFDKITPLEQKTKGLGRTPEGGIVDCIDVASGRSPLHVAAFNGSIACLGLLLKAGALVHLRDFLDHTALYYAMRQGHQEIAETLIQAGAHLGGSDVAGGFAGTAARNAIRAGDENSLRMWKRAGIDTIERQSLQ